MDRDGPLSESRKPQRRPDRAMTLAGAAGRAICPKAAKWPRRAHRNRRKARHGRSQTCTPKDERRQPTTDNPEHVQAGPPPAPARMAAPGIIG